MSETCVDASVVVKLALGGEPYRATARQLIRDSLGSGIELIAPPFYPSEVDSVIRKRAYEGRLSSAGAQSAFAVLDRAPVHVLSHSRLRVRARQIAEQFNQRTVYDASYAALAELRGCDFWTADKALYLGVQPSLAYVKYLPNYSRQV